VSFGVTLYPYRVAGEGILAIALLLSTAGLACDLSVLNIYTLCAAPARLVTRYLQRSFKRHRLSRRVFNRAVLVVVVHHLRLKPTIRAVEFLEGRFSGSF
jgi:hypothetical protein